jgi:cytosine/adenosine deaminase-related metal-dependent hydrolase
MRDCDLLVTHGLLVDGQGGVREDAALAALGNRLIEVGPSAELAARYRAARTLDASGKRCFGSSMHTHASATLFRVCRRRLGGGIIRPDVAHRGSSATRTCTWARWQLPEMIKNSYRFANHFSHMDQVARASGAGSRRALPDHAGPGFAQRARARGGRRFAERWAEVLRSIMLGPHAAYTCSDELPRGQPSRRGAPA